LAPSFASLGETTIFLQFGRQVVPILARPQFISKDKVD
jgi:hypothetical protein